jgi:hypothetical protein
VRSLDQTYPGYAKGMEGVVVGWPNASTLLIGSVNAGVLRISLKLVFVMRFLLPSLSSSHHKVARSCENRLQFSRTCATVCRARPHPHLSLSISGTFLLYK